MAGAFAEGLDQLINNSGIASHQFCDRDTNLKSSPR